MVKPYPLCSCAQPAAAALLAVLERENLAAAEVRGVHAVVTPMVAETLRFDRPENENQAMFSLTHALACVLTDREVTVGHVDRAALFRPDLRAAAARVSYAADDTAFDLARAPEAARVSVETEDGRRFEETVLRAPGDPASPLDDTAFGHKARSCLRRGLSLSDAERVEAMIGGLDGVSDLRDLTDLLAGPAAP